jgi:F-box/TPR repeat protein Pof3
VLDNRAATYSKLEQLHEARRDAKQMIKLGKNSDERVSLDFRSSTMFALTHGIQGYLRCAKVLLLEGKAEKALEIYAYGLKMLSADHPRRSVRKMVLERVGVDWMLIIL